MAKTPIKPEAVQAAPQTPTPDRFDITLEAFCAGQSVRENRPELIAAFYRSEQRAGSAKALESEFAARFQSFINRPA